MKLKFKFLTLRCTEVLRVYRRVKDSVAQSVAVPVCTETTCVCRTSHYHRGKFITLIIKFCDLETKSNIIEDFDNVKQVFIKILASFCSQRTESW